MKSLRLSKRFVLALALGSLGLAVSPAPAQTVIDSVPYTITASGHYTLSGNLNSGVVGTPAVSIQAPNVILDLGGYYVAGPGTTNTGNSTSDSVIRIGDVANVTIRNGTVAGNAYGIHFISINAATSRNYVVENVTVTRCYLTGIRFTHAAPGSVVKRCSLSTIGNSTFSANTTAVGILSYGSVRIEKNNISDVTSTGTDTSYGILGNNADFTIGNTIANCMIGVYGGKYLNNLTFNVATPFSSGTNAAGNN